MRIIELSKLQTLSDVAQVLLFQLILKQLSLALQRPLFGVLHGEEAPLSNKEQPCILAQGHHFPKT